MVGWKYKLPIRRNNDKIISKETYGKHESYYKNENEYYKLTNRFTVFRPAPFVENKESFTERLKLEIQILKHDRYRLRY